MSISGIGVKVETNPGPTAVYTSDHGGHTVEQLADMCVNKLMVVSDEAPPEIRDQAQAFKDRMRMVVEFYMRQVKMCDRKTIIYQLNKHGLKDYVDVIRSM